MDSSSPFHLEVGASVSVDSLMTAMAELKDTSGYEYLAELLDLWANVGSTALRSVSRTENFYIFFIEIFLYVTSNDKKKSILKLCSWAGNLALKSQINSFQSDLFISLVGCGAQVLIGMLLLYH